MASQNAKIESMLETLGKAHEDGIFAASPSFPWTSPSPRLKVTGLDPRQRSLRWLRVAAPLAAAAAVAVVFVLPNLSSSRNTVSQTNQLVQLSTPTVHVAELATAAKSTESAPTDECDYNGDGRVDGADIQAFMRLRMEGANRNPQLEAEVLQRCLLGK